MNNHGKDWEDELGHSFDALIRSEGVAKIAKMPVPTAPRFIRGVMARVLCGTAPYDFYGYMRGGQHIAMEAKHNDKRKTSMPIVAKKKKSSGLQEHQLDALAAAAESGCIARLVWRNGGVVMAIGNDKIMAVQRSYQEGGRKSIPADLFEVVEQRISQGCPYWSWLNADGDA
jgi:penicillin-binding protein-related factor A (putative recombinase)